MDASPGTMPRLHCQEITTGRRLMPIVDSGLVDNCCEVWAQGAAISQGMDYLAIYCLWQESRDIWIAFFVVWLIDSNFMFGQRHPRSWAQKVFSTFKFSKECSLLITLSERPLALNADGNLHSPIGRFIIAIGEEIPLPASVPEFQGELTFSSNGENMILDDEGMQLRYTTTTGDTERIADVVVETPCSFQDISHTGRFVVWRMLSDGGPLQDEVVDIDIKMLDMHDKSTTTL